MVIYRVDSNIHGNCDINDIEVTSKPGPRRTTAKDQKTPVGSELKTQQAVKLAQDFLSQMQALDHRQADKQTATTQAGAAVEQLPASHTELKKQLGKAESLGSAMDRCGLVSAPESPSKTGAGDGKRKE